MKDLEIQYIHNNHLQEFYSQVYRLDFIETFTDTNSRVLISYTSIWYENIHHVIGYSCFVETAIAIISEDYLE